MKIKLRTTVAGPHGSGSAGHVVTHFPEEFARQLVEGGFADLVETADLPLPDVVQPDAEAAVVVPRENAARKSRKVR